MKSGIIGLVMAASIVFAVAANAHEDSKHVVTPSKQVATTVKGELVDTGCYLGHVGKGESHLSCATMCVNLGMPMGILTRKGALYLVTMNHDNPDAYNKLKTMVGKNVAVTGHVNRRSGMTGIEIESFKPAG